jgi:hypothetical protein
MNNKYSRPILLIVFLATAFFGYQHFFGNSNEPTESKTSGAYEALNFFGAARVYPFDKMPNTAFIKAWRFIEEMTPAETATRSTDPWQTLGPHNRAGRMLKLAFNPLNPSTMLAGSASGGLWRSHTGGMGTTAWHQISTGYPVPAVGAIAFPPNDSMTIFIGTGEVYNYLTVGTGSAYRSTRGSYGQKASTLPLTKTRGFGILKLHRPTLPFCTPPRLTVYTKAPTAATTGHWYTTWCWQTTSSSTPPIRISWWWAAATKAHRDTASTAPAMAA